MSPPCILLVSYFKSRKLIFVKTINFLKNRHAISYLLPLIPKYAGLTSVPIIHFSAFMNMKKRKGIDFGIKKKFSKTVFLHVLKVLEHVSVDFRGVCTLYPVRCIKRKTVRFLPRLLTAL